MSNLPLNSIPSSLYRLQMNKDFPLSKAQAILPYLKELGVEGVYLSPIFDCISSHGYDVTNPNLLNPILGTDLEYRNFCLELKNLGFKQILDIVPNHMGIKVKKNAWWESVLEYGPYSPFALFFDINWDSEKKELHNKVLLPILGNFFGGVLEDQLLKLVWKDEKFRLSYGDDFLPICPKTYWMILEDLDGYFEIKAEAFFEYKELYKQFYQATQKGGAFTPQDFPLEKLSQLIQSSKEMKQAIIQRLDSLNGKKKLPQSFDKLEKILNAQYYRLAHWQVAAQEINYRRFFNIHELAAIRIELDEVFEAHHRFVFKLVEEGWVQGLRIDHPDGLYDPIIYFDRLKNKFNILIVVEKILDRKEELAENWDVDGTVGYEYLNLLNGVFVQQDNQKQISEIYENFLGSKVDFDELLYQNKKLFCSYHMASEIRSLGHKLDMICEKNRNFRDFTNQDLVHALQEIIACFPVYRTYIQKEGENVSDRDSLYLKIAIEKARKKAHFLDPSIFTFLKKLFYLQLNVSKEEKALYRDFILRFQQLTGPIMAKGLEDTTFYSFNRFISLNEVGGDPLHFGISPEEFHLFNQKKQKKWPFGFLASSTHDTKRSEDVRLRLNVISEIPKEWNQTVKKWALINSKYKERLNETIYPTPNTEYFLYQLLLGVWPLDFKEENRATLMERIWECILKSLREARLETDWIKPNEEYEAIIKKFYESIIQDSVFFKLFNHFLKKIARFGQWNSLSSTTLKLGSAGIAEIYQGCEQMVFSLVDPDNRRPVDYESAQEHLKRLKQQTLNDSLSAWLTKSMMCKKPNSLKQYLYWKGLNFRKANKELFLNGDYLPLKAEGSKKEHIIAYYRKFQDQYLIVIVGRFYAQLRVHYNQLPLNTIWEDTKLTLPGLFAGKEFKDLFTDQKIVPSGIDKQSELLVQDVFTTLPVAFLYYA